MHTKFTGSSGGPVKAQIFVIPLQNINCYTIHAIRKLTRTDQETVTVVQLSWTKNQLTYLSSRIWYPPCMPEAS